MAYAPDDFEERIERDEYSDQEYGYEEEKDEAQWLDETEELIKEPVGKKKFFMIVALVILVLILAALVGYHFFGYLFSPGSSSVQQEEMIVDDNRVTAKEPEEAPPKEDKGAETKSEADVKETDSSITFEEETNNLYTYIERRPIPSNPFAPIPKPQAAAAEPAKPEPEKPSSGSETGETKEEKEEAAASFVSRLSVKGIVGYEDKRLAILEEDGLSFIINEGNIIELFHSDGVLKEQWRVEEITKTKVILFDVLKGLSQELVLGGER